MRKRVVRFYLVVILSSFFLSSCSSDKKKISIQEIKQKSDVIEIDLDNGLESDSIIFTSSLFKKVDVIQLETNQQSLIGSIKKIATYDSLLIVLDANISKGVFLFHKENGRFFKRVGQIGEGPGEYTNPHDFTIDYKNKLLYILDTRANSIISYTLPEGEFIRTVKIQNRNIRSHYIQYFNDKLYADADSYIDTNNDFMLREIDVETGEQIAGWLENKKYNRGYNNRLGNNTFHITDNPFIYSPYVEGILFVQNFMDTIISIKEEGIYPFLSVKSKNWVSAEDINLLKESKINVFEGLLNINKIYRIGNYFETPDYLFFSYSQGLMHKGVMYNKNNHIGSGIICILDDLVFQIDIKKGDSGMVPEHMYNDENGVYCFSYFSDMGRFLDIRDKNKLSPNIAKNEKIVLLEEDSNPVIFYYQYN